jgi:hypothetical protein
MVVAAFVEKARPPRALLWGLVGMLLLVGGLIVGLAMALDPDVGPGTGGGFLCLCCAPLGVLVFVPGIYALAKAWPDLRVGVTADEAHVEAILSGLIAAGQKRSCDAWMSARACVLTPRHLGTMIGQRACLICERKEYGRDRIIHNPL